jgi:hypothetical protein
MVRQRGAGAGQQGHDRHHHQDAGPRMPPSPGSGRRRRRGQAAPDRSVSTAEREVGVTNGTGPHRFRRSFEVWPAASADAGRKMQ